MYGGNGISPYSASTPSESTAPTRVTVKVSPLVCGPPISTTGEPSAANSISPCLSLRAGRTSALHAPLTVERFEHQHLGLATRRAVQRGRAGITLVSLSTSRSPG